MDKNNLYADVVLKSDLIKLRHDLYQGLINLKAIQEIENEKPYDLGYNTGSIDTLVTVLDLLSRILEN